MSALQFSVGPGVTEFNTAVFSDYAKTYKVDLATLGAATTYLPIPKDEVVLGVRGVVTTAITGNSVSTVKLGDSADDDGFMAAGDLALTAGAMCDSRGLGFNTNSGAGLDVWAYRPFAKGKLYTAANFVKITFDQIPTAGVLYVDVFFRGFGDPDRQEVRHHN